jgi:hypothetical protein
MKKGFLFTTDALFALLTIIAMLSAYSFYFSAKDSSFDALSSLEMQTRDAAIVGMYLNKNPSEFGMSEDIFLTTSQAKCERGYYYSVGESNQPETKNYCKEI